MIDTPESMKDKQKVLNLLNVCRSEIERIMIMEIRLFIRNLLKFIEEKRVENSSESDSDVGESEELMNELKVLGIKPNIINTVVRGKNQKSDFFYLNDLHKNQSVNTNTQTSDSFFENN